ncbi:hypothetical protein EYR40_002192 [Pleurotus pulmonarius]|nr:hypothetical protein EYR36_002314 [Pleurotus pulmonarius]KAF4583701.1 hypothetical protein EYR40_002192 [Pleurotus pulmonarius]KAF4587981.1 hypothetical protein EYR38_009942 [Pleurotus pulmonarius]
MNSVLVLAIFAALGLAPSTGPVPGRAAPAAHLQACAPIDDTAVLNYALTLEHLESAFYSGALARFDAHAFADAGLPASARARITEIAAHEQLLQTLLRDKAVRPCEYFFPYRYVRLFAALSQVLEGVGASAYIGAAAFITDKVSLTVAASILSTEARHASYVQAAVNNLAPWSGPFDAALSMNTAYSLARLFITACPDADGSLRARPFPALTVVTCDPQPGSQATLEFEAPGGSGALWLALFSGLEKKFVRIDEGKEVAIPAGMRGTVYGVVSRSANSTRDEGVVAGVAILQFD